MSALTDLLSLRNRVEQLEADLDRSKIDFNYSVDLVQEYKDQRDELRDRYTALKLENKCLTRKLNEPNAQFASPPIAPQPGEVDTLRQRLAEKDQVIAAKDEKYQSLLDSIKPAFNNLKDAVKTLEALQIELAQGRPPPDGDANSKTSATQGATRTLSGHADSKTSVTKGATKAPSERPATRSKSPDPGQQPSIEGSDTYSGVVTTKRAELPRRPRAGQARLPFSHEDLAKKEALQAEEQEEIQRGAGRSQKPNRGGGFQPSQKAPRSSDFVAPPAAKPNVTDSHVPKQPHGASFVVKEDPPSSPIAKENVTVPDFRNWGASFVARKDRPSSPVPK
ncbi:hypothetical protein JMJ35_001159 [Cladonia borealis]|uniref:Uncharacterized protein n=1 Tax=Cladonia borealis TaxID=184061 RepID=A0AA39R9F0_9LECA|nr:hypothetical protein JMJ35_001159 [Cladonia borealis]